MESIKKCPECGEQLVNGEGARLLDENARLRKALKELLAASPCQNACEPDDMSCATNAARAALK